MGLKYENDTWRYENTPYEKSVVREIPYAESSISNHL